MLLACIKDVVVSLRSVAVTSAGFSLVSNLEAVSVISNRCMCCKAVHHLGSERQGVSCVFEPCATVKMGWFHVFGPGMVLSGRSPPGVEEVSTNICRRMGEQVIPVFECIVCDLNPVEFEGSESMGPIFHFRRDSEVVYFLVWFEHIVHGIRDMVEE